MQEILKSLKIYAQENHVPIIREHSAKLLSELCAKEKPSQILEIGTAIGYSGIIMLNASGRDSRLTTLEINEQRAIQAKQNFNKAKLLNRVNLIEGDALDSLKAFTEQNKLFDLVLLDGPKGQYIKYLPYIKILLRKEGILFADDIYLHGWVKSQEKIPHKNRAMVYALRNFIKTLEEDKDLETQFLEIEDGLSISKKLK